MNTQMAPQYQAQYQTQLPQQYQDTVQQRQVPNGKQQIQGHGQRMRDLGQQQFPNPYANHDPQLALFTLEKPKNAKSWEDVEPEQQHVALQDLQNELAKFRRNRGSVKRNLSEISSANCRRLINELVEEQTQELWKYNRTLQYRIASVEVEWRSVNRRNRQLKRVQVILETEPSGFQEIPLMRTGGGGAGNPNDALEPSKAMKPNNMNQNQQLQGQPTSHALNTAQQPRIHQQSQAQHMAQSQHLEQQPMRAPPPPSQNQGQGQMHGHGNAPPPPPPPASSQVLGQPGMGAPLAPPPGGGQAIHAPPHVIQHPQIQNVTPQGRRLPGAFPEPMPMPVHGMRPGQVPSFEAMDPRFLKEQKSTHKSRHGSSSSSSSDSEWDSESGSSGSGPIRVLPVEQGDYGLVGRRERGRSQHSTKSKKSRRHRSQSKTRSRSRSRGPRIVDPYKEKSSRRRRDTESFDPPPMGKYSPISSKASSPRVSRAELPPIHIHMNTNNTTDERTREHEQLRNRGASLNTSPTSFHNDKRKLENINTSTAMSRESSWDRASGTASFGTSSAYTAEDAIFDTPMRRPSVSRGHGLTNSYSRPQEPFHHPHPSHIYDDVEPRPKARYPPADDYPRVRDSYFEEPMYGSRPSLPHRRNSVQVPIGNPFATAHYPPKPTRAVSYAADMHEPSYTFPQRRAIADRADQDERVDLQDIADALEHIKESRRVPLKRLGSARRNSAVYSGDEWDARYPPSRRSAYGGYQS